MKLFSRVRIITTPRTQYPKFSKNFKYPSLDFQQVCINVEICLWFGVFIVMNIVMLCCHGNSASVVKTTIGNDAAMQQNVLK